MPDANCWRTARHWGIHASSRGPSFNSQPALLEEGAQLAPEVIELVSWGSLLQPHFLDLAVFELEIQPSPFPIRPTTWHFPLKAQGVRVGQVYGFSLLVVRADEFDFLRHFPLYLSF